MHRGMRRREWMADWGCGDDARGGGAARARARTPQSDRAPAHGTAEASSPRWWSSSAPGRAAAGARPRGRAAAHRGNWSSGGGNGGSSFPSISRESAFPGSSISRESAFPGSFSRVAGRLTSAYVLGVVAPEGRSSLSLTSMLSPSPSTGVSGLGADDADVRFASGVGGELEEIRQTLDWPLIINSSGCSRDRESSLLTADAIRQSTSSPFPWPWIDGRRAV